MLTSTATSLTFSQDNHTLTIEPWGPNALRIRSTVNPLPLPSENWALSEPLPSNFPTPQISCPTLESQPTLPLPGTIAIEPIPFCKPGTITSDNLTATITPLGHLEIHDISSDGTKRPILIEKTRTRIDPLSPTTSALEIPAREFKAITGTNSFRLKYRLESLDPEEQIYGGGQYQQPNLDLKGCELELAQRNSQASVPFFVSSLGYGILWNNPSIGRVFWGKNGTTFEAESSSTIDIWIVCPPADRSATNGSPSSTSISTGNNTSITNDEPAPNDKNQNSNPSNNIKQSTNDKNPQQPTTNVFKQILSHYANVTGHAPAIPSFALGFWQCKLRYRTQDEILSVAREFRRRNLPLSVLVVDFFHWPTQGDWKFDPQFFPDPSRMIAELDALKVKLLISIWPTVDRRSANYGAMHEQGLLIRSEVGPRIAMDFMGNTVHADFTNPAAREFVWAVVARNYFALGARLFWLDEAEPEYAAYDFGQWRYFEGANLAVGNVYPIRYAQAFWDGQRRAGQKPGEIANLVRCTWAGGQKFGAVLWSGDIASSWASLRNQLAAGLNVGMSGIPWWTTDIGGFHGGVTADPAFRELLVRWFQWGAFCPVMRLHGDREPKLPRLGEGGGSECVSGADNEPWSFGEDNYPVLVRYMRFRERLRGYLEGLMRQASEVGTPLMRPMWLEFPGDGECWRRVREDQYMFGERYLVAPVMKSGMTKKDVYLPSGTKWAMLEIKEDSDGLREAVDGGRVVEVELSMEEIPVFVRVVEE